MNDVDLRKIDLQLLQQFEVLLGECHVSRAAATLGISQPAMSGVLARLRRLFNDPLLTKTPTGMMPTPRALQIAPHVRQAVMHLESALAPPLFDPASDRRRFAISISDVVAPLLLPGLAQMQRQQGPGLQLVLWPSQPALARERLEDGSYDLVIGDREMLADGLHCSNALVQPLRVIARAAGDDDGAALTLPAYLKGPHVVHVGRTGLASIIERDIDAVLQRRRLAREVAMKVPSLLYAAMAVAHSDMLATVPRLLAERLATQAPLRVLTPPLRLAQRTVALGWHARSHADAGHQWLRRQILKMCAAL